MTEKWYAKEMSDDIKLLYSYDFGRGLPVVYLYTAAEHEEAEKLRALYRAASLDGSVGAVNEALHAIDGGTYSTKVAGEIS